MRYFIIISGEYILGIYIAKDGTHEISKEEYERIFAVLQNAPEPPEGYGYRLKVDLSWEMYELPPESEE